MSWETLKINRKFEIWNEYPYPIREVRGTRNLLDELPLCEEMIFKDNPSDVGYMMYRIEWQLHYKDYVLAVQWARNKPIVHHINNKTLDNRLTNLVWLLGDLEEHDMIMSNEQKSKYRQVYHLKELIN